MITALVLITCSFFVRSTLSADNVLECNITEKLATHVSYEFADVLDEPYVRNSKDPMNCSAIIGKILNYATLIKAKLNQDTERIFGSSFDEEKSGRLRMFHEIVDVKQFESLIKKSYFEKFRENLNDIEDEVKNSLATQVKLQNKLDLYAFISNNKKLDIDENTENDAPNTCKFSGTTNNNT